MDAEDQAWTTSVGHIGGITFSHMALYKDEEVRDWRFLWLRKRTVSKLIAVIADEEIYDLAKEKQQSPEDPA